MCYSEPFPLLGKLSRTLILGVSCQFCLMNQSVGFLRAMSISLSVPFFLRLMPLPQKLAIGKQPFELFTGSNTALEPTQQPVPGYTDILS